MKKIILPAMLAFSTILFSSSQTKSNVDETSDVCSFVNNAISSNQRPGVKISKSNSGTYTYTFDGYIGSYATRMILKITNGRVNCTYWYYNQLNSQRLHLTGYINGRYIKMSRKTNQGKYVFEGNFNSYGNYLEGTFDTPYNYYTCSFSMQ